MNLIKGHESLDAFKSFVAVGVITIYCYQLEHYQWYRNQVFLLMCVPYFLWYPAIFCGIMCTRLIYKFRK